MTRAEMVELVGEALRETQRMSGRTDAFTVGASTVPIGDLPDFDSLNGIEATLVLEERLGGSLPENLFTDDTTGQPLAIGAVVDRLLELATAKGSDLR